MGIPVTTEYVSSRGFIYSINGFYKSSIVTIEKEDGVLIATSRYNTKNEIKEPKDIVELNKKWWLLSKDRLPEWNEPSELWKQLYEKFSITLTDPYS